VPIITPGGGGSGGSQVAALIGPFDKTFAQINAALGAPIVLGSSLAVGSLVEPFAFFPTFFENGAPDNALVVGIIRPAASLVSGEAVQFDANAPGDEDASYGVSGLFDMLGRFPRRTVYRIKQAGCTLGLVSGTGFTRGEVIVWAFVWTP
jgi:hypothetical protein